MNLRFLKKKDGTKVLQQSLPDCRAGYTGVMWADIPMVEEETIMSKIQKVIFDYNYKYGENPSEILLGMEEWNSLLVFIEQSSSPFPTRELRNDNCEVCGVSVKPRRSRRSGIFTVQKVD